MEFISNSLSEYVEAHSQVESELLKKIDRETHLEVLRPRMLSGHLQGRVLSILSKMINPKNVLEIGTYTGYSALCLAEGLQKEGKLITIEKNAELEGRANAYFSESEFENQIEFRLGSALDIIPLLNQKFDIVFIDADKPNYLNYYNLVFDKINSGGFIIADNVLWSGKVVEPLNESDLDTKALVNFNTFIQQDIRVENILFPIRDGLMIIRKL